MPYILDLAGCWAKLEHAKMHVDILRAEIADAGKPDPNLVPIRHQFEPDEGAVIYRIERVIQVRDHWSLIAGDAVHNLRGALDHLAWQLAMRYYNGVTPTDWKIVRDIQFPIAISEKRWAATPYRKYMLPADRAEVEKLQPFNMMGPPNPKRRVVHFLQQLANFSNADKHREIQLFYPVVQTGEFPLRNVLARDCMPLISGDGRIIGRFSFVESPPSAGDEVARFTVVPTGPNPDVHFEPRFTGHVSTRENWDIMQTLDYIGTRVADIIRTFEPVP